MEDVLPIIFSRLKIPVEIRTLDPSVDSVNDSLANNWLKLSGKEQVLGRGGVDLLKINQQEIVWAASAPINDGLVLALAALLPPPIGQMKVVVDDGRAKFGIFKSDVEKRFRRKKRKAEDSFESVQSLLVPFSRDIFCKISVQANPIGTAIDLKESGFAKKEI